MTSPRSSHSHERHAFFDRTAYIGFICAALALASCVTACDRPSPVANHPGIQMEPSTFAATAGESVDLRVTITGATAPALFTCRVVPASGGTTQITGATCRFTVAPGAMPGTLVIVQFGSVADTATLAMRAG